MTESLLPFILSVSLFSPTFGGLLNADVRFTTLAGCRTMEKAFARMDTRRLERCRRVDGQPLPDDELPTPQPDPTPPGAAGG